MTFLTLSSLYSILVVFCQWYIFFCGEVWKPIQVVYFCTDHSLILRKSNESNSRQTPVPNAAVRPSLFSPSPKFHLRKKRRAEWVVRRRPGSLRSPNYEWQAMFEHLRETRWQAATVVPIEKRLWFTVHMNFILLRLSRFIFIRIIVLAEASNALDLTKLKIGLSDLIIKMGLGFEACLWLVTWRRCIFIHALKQILQMNDDHGSPIPWRCDWRRDVVSDVASWNIHSEISRIQIFEI